MSALADPTADARPAVRMSTTNDLRAVAESIRTLAPATDDSERIERLRLLEELKAVACAAQVQETAEFAASQRSLQAGQGLRAEHRGRGVAAQVALAMRASHYRGTRFVALAQTLSAELPMTYAELRVGRTTEWRATLMARETACLSREQRAHVDAELAPQLVHWGDRRVAAEAARLAYRLDAQAVAARHRKAESDRRVGTRPAPDGLCTLTIHAPLAQTIAGYAALRAEADRRIGLGLNANMRDPGGPPLTRSQLMADIAIERLTGLSEAGDLPVEVNLIMTDTTLFEHDTEPAVVPGFGPIPAAVARDIVYGAQPAKTTPRWLRRLYADPVSGRLVAMDSRRRLFTDNQQRFLRLRDQTCRTPWCDAPIEHADHVVPWADGGVTSIDNGEGFCAACNHAKQAPGWHSDSDGDTIIVITPTRNTYRSRPPAPPGAEQRRRRRRHRTHAA